MGHISFPWSYIFWRSTSLGLPCKSNPTPTTKMEKIAIFTTSILAEGTGKTHSKRHGCAVLPPFYQKQYHWFIAWIHQRGCSQFFFYPIRREGHLSSAGVSPTPMWVVHHLPPTAPEKSLHALESTRESKRVHLLQSFGMKIPKLFET